MFDGRVPLPVGAELCGGGARYRITGAPVGRGGSSLVYPASRQGSGRMFMIKECYPLCAEHEYLRRDWMVAPAAQKAGAEEYLARLRADMAREDALGQRLARSSGRALAAWETLRPCRLIVEGRSLEAPEGAFIVMEGPGRGWFLRDLLDECARPPGPGRPLRCGGLPGPELVLRIMEELLKPLRDIHRAGCIHGDVQAENLFLMGPDAERGDIGVGRLLDFGSARELGPDGFTAPIADRRVFFTPGYAAPELLRGNDGRLRLSPASDVYSAGCLLMYLLRGEGYREALGEALALRSGLTPPLTRRQAERCGFHGEAASRLMWLLGRALAAEPEERYAGADAMLDDLLELEQLVLPPKYRLPEDLAGSPYFCEASREKELARLEADFNAGRQPLWVWGIWGVGKTELAKAFGRRMKRRGLDVHLVTSRGSLRETVLGMEFSGLGRPAAGPAREEREYRRRLDILKDWYEDSLLIIDGLGSGARDLDELRAEPEYAELCALKLRLLITTRSRPDTVTPELVALDEAQALALYESAAPTDRSARGEVRALLRELDCHPLAVELCARAVEEDWGVGRVTPRTLLAQFRHGGGGDVHEQLRRLFALQELGEGWRGLLCHIALLPDCGLDAALFLSCEAPEDRRRLRRLEARGWVRRGADDLLRIHPLVRSVLTEELKPRDADCAAFLSAVCEQLGSDTDERLYAQGADLYIRASELLEDEHGDFASCAGRCCYAVGRAAEAAYYAAECLRIREALTPPDALALARARLNCSITQRHFGDLAGAIADAERAAQLLHGLPPCVEQGRAEASLAATYAVMGDARRALRHGERALELLRDTAPGDSPALENAHLILARAHMLSGEAGAAQAHAEKALRLCEARRPEDSLRLADVCALAAEPYLLSEDEEGANRAEALLCRALDIRERRLPWEHADMAAVCGQLSLLYERLGKPELAAEYAGRAQKASQGLRRTGGAKLLKSALRRLAEDEGRTDANALARDLRAAAQAYRLMQEPDEAEPYIRRALSLLEGGAGDALEEYLCLSEAVEISLGRSDTAVALVRAAQAMELLQSRLPEEAGLRSSCALRLADLYRRRGDTERALGYYELAIELQRSCACPDAGLIDLAEQCILTLRAGRR